MLDNILKGFKSQGGISKDKYMLSMQKNELLIYNPRMEKRWHNVNIAYLPQYDVKRDNQPVIKWKNN